MTEPWQYIGLFLVIALLGTVFFGAPYVPTRSRDVQKMLGLLDPKDVLMDLGSGDGRLVKAAALRDIRAYGVELSPLLALVSWLGLGKARRLATISWGNYWHKKLPSDVTVVFVFLADQYMKKLREYLEAEATRLGRTLRLVSYGFELPGYRPARTEGALLVYEIQP